MSDAAPQIADCHVCDALIPALLGPSPSQTIGTIDALIMRSNLPCQTCSIILLEIRDSHILGSGADGLELSGNTPLKLEIKDSNTPVKISILDEGTNTKLGELVLGLEDPGLPLLPHMVPHKITSERFFSRPSWNAANATDFPALPRLWTAAYIAAWLTACKRDHQELCSQAAGADKPTRLIRIQPDGTLKLIHTADLPADERSSLVYATVSHVWGTSVLLRLLTTNIDALRTAIPLASLAPKFREVVALATLLGLSHLWIDTLCIIQDSRADWAAEGARMAAVYQNTHLNFALVGSAPDDSVLPAHGNVHGLSRKRVRLLHPRRGPITLYLSPSAAVVGRMFNSTRTRPPLFTRGWVLQERFLARRTVFLGETQLAWECATCLWLESTGTRDHYGKLGFEAYRKRPVLEEAAAAAEGPEAKALGWRRHWDKFVIAYTSAGLTYETDKLAAVAGIARAFAGLSGHEYVGGMWREHVQLGGLLWKVNPTEGRRPGFRGAPSWSWASVDGAVSNLPVFVRAGAGDPWRFHVPTTELVDLQVTWPTRPDAVFGEVEEAVIRVKGRMMAVGPHDAETTMDAHFDDPNELTAPGTVMACVLCIMGEHIDGLLLRADGDGLLYRRVGAFGYKSKDGARIAQYPETVVAIR